jgi:hypothetical protein
MFRITENDADVKPSTVALRESPSIFQLIDGSENNDKKLLDR